MRAGPLSAGLLILRFVAHDGRGRISSLAAVTWKRGLLARPPWTRLKRRLLAPDRRGSDDFVAIAALLLPSSSSPGMLHPTPGQRPKISSAGESRPAVTLAGSPVTLADPTSGISPSLLPFLSPPSHSARPPVPAVGRCRSIVFRCARRAFSPACRRATT